MSRQWKRGALTVVTLIMLASPTLFAQNTQGSRPRQGKPMQQGRSNSIRIDRQSQTTRQGNNQQRGSFGIYAEEWQALSTEDQAKLRGFITEIGLDIRPNYRATVAFMSPEERLAHFNSPEVQKERTVYQAKLFKFWETTAYNFDIGPYSSQRIAMTKARLEAQQNRIDRQERSMDDLNRFIAQQEKRKI